jgi:PAS domain S-box-containing protein
VTYSLAVTCEELKKKVEKLEKEALKREQADETLRKSEERYRMIFNYWPQGIVHFDSNGIILDCNECFMKIVGAPKEKLIGVDIIEFFADRGMQSAILAGLAGKVNCFEGDYRSPDGEKIKPVRALFSRITSEDGRSWDAVGLFEHISEPGKVPETLGESREFLSRIVNSISDPIFVKDRKHHFVLVNDAECVLAGRDRMDILGKTDYEFFPKDQVDIFWEKDELVFETGESNENEEEITDKSGATRTIVTKKTLYTDYTGNKFIVGIIRDITDRKEAELALQVAHQELQDIIEFLPDATFVIDRDKKVLFWNRAMEEMTGIRKADILGKGDYAYAVPFYGAKRPMFIDLVVSEQPDIEQEYDFIKRTGNSIYGESYVPGTYQGKGAYMWSTAAPLFSKGGNIIGFIQSIRDISDRKRAEDALRKTSSLLHNTFQANPDLLTVHDRNLRVVLSNWRGREGPSQEGSTDISHCYECYMRRNKPCERCPTLEVFRTGRAVRMEVTNPHTQRIFEVNAFPVYEASGHFELVTEHVRDITERKQAEETLRQSEERFRELAENIREVFWVITPKEVLYVSPAYEEIYGRTRASLYIDPDSLFELIVPGDNQRIRQAFQDHLRTLGLFEEQYRIIRPDGVPRWIRARAFPVLEQGQEVRSVGIAEDVTSLKEAEEFLCIERDLALGLGATGSLVTAMELLLEASLKSDSLDAGGIYLIDGDTKCLRLVCHRGLLDSFVEQVSFFEPDSPVGRFAMKGEPGYCSRPADILAMGDLFQSEGITVLAAIPVRVEGEVVALLIVGSHVLPEIHGNIRSAIETIATHIGAIVSRVRLGEQVKAQGDRLQETNAALRVLLKQRELDRTDLEESMLSNVKRLILPYIEKLKRSRLSDDQRVYVEILESHLQEITSPFVRKISAPMLGLTPMEIRVADLIRQGKSSKEIADLIAISERAVIFHRQGIRGKLGLRGRKANLQTYLSALS